MKTALIVSGGGFQGLTLLSALQQRDDVRTIVCDIHPENPTRYLCLDYRIAPHLANTDAFRSFLLDTIKRDRVNAIFPATAWELPTLSRLKNQLEEQGTYVAVSNPDLLEILLDKRRTYEWLERLGLPTPETFTPTDFTFDTPLFGRPRDGWGGRGAIIIRDTGDVHKHAAYWPTHVWTRWLSKFEEFSLDFAISPGGVVSPVVMRQRLRTTGGFAVISESTFDKSLQQLAGHIANAISGAGGRGLFNAQILAPHQGTYFISDVNPRSGTSATHALAEGINLPGFFIDAATGSTTGSASLARKKRRTIRVLRDISIPYFEAPPKGVVFDLDDTLIDHKLWMFKKMEAVYSECFATRVDRKDYLLSVAQLIDEGVRNDLIDRLLDELSLPTDLRDDAICAYRETVVIDTPLFMDAEQTLLALKGHGLQIAVLTDNPPSTQRSKIAHAQALNCLDATIFTRECGGEKPRSAGFTQAARSLSLTPQQLIMVGDNYFRDGLGAIQAGYMHALIVKRNGAFVNPHGGLAKQIATRAHERIDIVDNLLSVYQACVLS